MASKALRLLRLVRLLNASGGKLKGEKKLHKIVYIAQRLGYPFDEGFVWHNYGPYSPTLDLEMHELEADGLVTSSRTEEHGYTTSVYQLTDRGEEFLSALEGLEPSVPTLDKLVCQLNKKRTGRDLELIASIMYWEAHGFDRPKSIAQVRERKPQYRPKECIQALQDLDALSAYSSA